MRAQQRAFCVTAELGKLSSFCSRAHEQAPGRTQHECPGKEMGGEISTPRTLDAGGSWSVQSCDQGRTVNEQPAIAMSPWEEVVTVCERLRREADFQRRRAAVGRWDVTGKGSPAVGVLEWADCKRSGTGHRAHTRRLSCGRASEETS